MRTKVKHEPNLLQATDGQQVVFFQEKRYTKLRRKRATTLPHRCGLIGGKHLLLLRKPPQCESSDDAHTDDV